MGSRGMSSMQGGGKRNAYTILVRKLEGGDPGIDGKIILKWILKKENVGM
jgi:hypothetical protein